MFGYYTWGGNYVKSVLTWQKSSNKELISSLTYLGTANCQLRRVVINLWSQLQSAFRSPAISFARFSYNRPFTSTSREIVRSYDRREK